MGRPKKAAVQNGHQDNQIIEVEKNSADELAWGAKVPQIYQISTFDNKNITFRGELKGYDYDKILRDKQKYIYDLYSLSDYFCDKDQIYRGIIKNVYVQFSLSGGYKLTGVNEKTKQRYMDFYKIIGFGDFSRSVFLQLYKYENVFCYLKEDGKLITLPVHKVRIADITVNGEPVIELNITEMKKAVTMTGTTKEDFLKTVKMKYDGYPEEVKSAIAKGDSEWVQLNPENTFYLSGLKEDWLKYAVPMVAACLEPFSKKTLITAYENSQLALGMRGFLHVMVGDKDFNKTINRDALDANVEIFKNALSGLPLAVTNWMVKSEWKSVDTKTLFDKNKYREVNSDILAAGGISSVIVAGDAEGGGSTSFASAQVSMKTAASRIKQNLDNFEEMMDKINLRLSNIMGVTSTKVPNFRFNSVDLLNDGKFREECFKLWQQGVLSTESLHEEYRINHAQEKERKEKENTEKYTEIFTLPPSFNNQKNEEENDGRPTKEVEDSKQDKNNSQNAPKPSTT